MKSLSIEARAWQPSTDNLARFRGIPAGVCDARPRTSAADRAGSSSELAGVVIGRSATRAVRHHAEIGGSDTGTHRMARKTHSRTRAPARTKRPPIAAVTTRLHLPRTWRVVTSRKLRASDADLARQRARREVPEIRLSGEWLARVGFPKGCRYLISAEKKLRTIYLQAD